MLNVKDSKEASRKLWIPSEIVVVVVVVVQVFASVEVWLILLVDDDNEDNDWVGVEEKWYKK